MCDQHYEDKQAIRALLERYCVGGEATPCNNVFPGASCIGVVPDAAAIESVVDEPVAASVAI